MRLNQVVSRTQLTRQIKRSGQAGVSLLEFVIGLVLLAIILLGVTLFYSSYTRQLDPVFQFRAVSLAEAVAEQVLAVKYDAANNPFEQKRCGEDGAAACANTPTASPAQAEQGLISAFSVVDDFALWCNNAIAGNTLAQQLGLSRVELYQRFTVSSCVEPMPKIGGEPAYKKVSIKVSIDSGSSISFQLQRYNIR